MDIGAKIKRIRLSNQLTLEELANRSELTKGFLSQLERDLTSPSVATLENILEALGTNLKDKKVTVKMKAGEGGRTFGSVSTKEISAAAKEQLGLELDKKKMQLAEPIRSFGVVEVPVKLHTKVTGKLAVHVVEL